MDRKRSREAMTSPKKKENKGKSGKTRGKTGNLNGFLRWSKSRRRKASEEEPLGE